MTDEMYNQVNSLCNELDATMQTLPGSIERISHCTLTEEWRHNHGYAFDGSGAEDHDLWRDEHELFEEGANDEFLIRFVNKYMAPCQLTKFVVLVKYPLVHKYIEENGGW